MKYKYLILVLLIGSGCMASNVFEPIKFGKNEVIFSQASKKIDVIDPTTKTNSRWSNFPGGRGPNQFVAYTSEFGDRTNTNEYGTEALIQNGIVTVLSGANSFIPADGIVISGHGSAKAWMNKNIAIGTRIYIDKETNTLNAYTTSESYMYEAEEKIKEAKSMIDYYKGKSPNYSWRQTANHIEDAQNYLKKAKKDKKEQENLKKESELSIKKANEALLSVLPGMPGELKGVWIRPTEKTENQIIKTIKEMEDAGIKDIFLETYYHGKTIYPSKVMETYGFYKQNELFNEFDPLKIWLKEAHKRNMKIHIWFQSFYVGNATPSKNPKSILAIHPEWGNKIQKDYKNINPTSSKSEHNGYFLDPANPQVQEFLIQLINEIVLEYSPDGINLDYIRYPQAISKTETGNWGYTKFAREDFKDIYKKDPVDLKKTDELWDEWNEYRRENITNFVRKVGAIGKENKIYTSAVIFPDIENALNSKQQDWRTWSRRDYIDGFTPLFLTYDPKMVASMMKDVNSVKAGNTNIYAGIFVTFMGGANEDLVRQIHEARKLKSDGIILFDWNHTKDKYTQMLSQSAFREVKNKSSEPKKQSENVKKEKKKRKFRLFRK